MDTRTDSVKPKFSIGQSVVGEWDEENVSGKITAIDWPMYTLVDAAGKEISAMESELEAGASTLGERKNETE